MTTLFCAVLLAEAQQLQHVVTLSQGDQFIVSLIDADADILSVQHPIFGELRIPHSQILSLKPLVLSQKVTSDSPLEPAKEVGTPGSAVSTSDSEVQPEVSALPQQLPAKQLVSAKTLPLVDSGGRSDQAGRPPAPPKPTPSPWTGSIGAALTASKAVTSTYNMRLSGSLNHKSADSATSLSISYYLNSSAGVITDNDLLARGDHNWLRKESNWELFVQSTYQYDEFEAWAHRVSPYGGVGYRIVDEEDLKFTIKSGGGLTWEQNAGIVRPQVLLEFESSWTIDESQSIAGYSSIAPDVNNPADYLATIKWDWRIRLGKTSPLALSIGVRNIYDSMPGAGENHNDFKAWAGVTLNF
ncbi:MAG: DUF481 domain-containing protein [Phycisphaerales bacterium]|nr:DUF481 domain-containing protein [Phycisphaerales bacterium]